MTIPKTCERCGGPVAWLRSQESAEVYRCVRCAHLMILPPEPSAEQEEPLVDVEVFWRTGHPTVAEVEAVRRLLPHLSQRSPRELVRVLAASRRLDLGRHHRAEARELQAQGRALGLDVRFVL